MTAINAFTDNRFAYLSTDGAIYDPATRRVCGLASKAIMLADMRMVIAFSGRWVGYDALIDALDGDRPTPLFPTQAFVLDGIPAALRRLKADNDRDGRAGRFGNFAFTVAMFDDAQQRPRILHAVSDGCPEPAVAEPYVVHEIEGLMMPRLDTEVVARIYPAVGRYRPRQLMRQVLMEQRGVDARRFGLDCGLGGTCQFYRIGANGVHVDALVRFPEGVGDRMNSSLPGVALPSPMDTTEAV